jgi:hypothetical protein
MPGQTMPARDCATNVEGSIMSSEIIVVLVLIVLAVGFIFWVRMNDGKSDETRKDEKGESGAQ